MKKAILFFAVTIASGHAATIGINFTHDGTNAAAPDDILFGSASTAGAPGFAQSNWNHMVTDWSGNAGNDATLANLVTSTGAAASELQNIVYPGHADPVHFDSNNTWSSASGNATPNDTLMNGYLDDGGNDQPYVNLSLSGVANATIVLYVHGDGAPGTIGRYWLEEWTDPLVAGTVITDQIAIAQNDYTGTFVSAGTFGQTGTPANVDGTSGGNYIVFENITASNIRIRGAGNGDPEDAGRGPINGFQVITTPVPEPSSSLLALLGSLALIRRRRL